MRDPGGAQPADLCFLIQLFLIQLQVGLIQQVRGGAGGGAGAGLGARGGG